MQKPLRNQIFFEKFSKSGTLPRELSPDRQVSLKHWQKLFIFLLCLLPVIGLQAQSTANYTFSNTTNGSLVLDRNGNAIDMSSGTTQLVANNSDDIAGGVTNIGFEFFLMGKSFTQFSTSDNGLIRLGSTALSSTTRVLTGASSTAPLIAPFSADLSTGNTGKVHYKLIGSAPNRTLVVEYLNMSLLFITGTPYQDNGTFQVRLYESSGIIEMVYGTMVHNGATGTGTDAVSIGFAAGTTNNNLVAITSATNASSLTIPFTTQTYSAGAITNLNSSSDGFRTVYAFVPATVNAPSGLSFASITGSTMTLNWTDNSTGETGFIISKSTDNINFTTLTTTAADVVTYAATGLSAGTTYYWKVTAIKENGASISGQASTTAGSTYTWTGASGGSWATSTNWTPTRTTPSTTDILQFNTSVTVTGLPTTQTIGQLLLSNNANVTLQPSAAAALIIDGGGGTDFDIPAGSTLNLTSSFTFPITFTASKNSTGNIAGTLNITGATTTTTFNASATTTAVAITGTVNVNTGGVLTGTANLSFASGANYNLIRAVGGTVPTATYDANSTINITGVTTSMTWSASSVGNVIWNSPSQSSASTFSSTLATVNGNFTVISTGTGSFAFGAGPSTVIKGNLIQSGGTVILATSSGTLTINGDFNQSGGTFNMNSGASATTLALFGNLTQSGSAVISRTGASGASVVSFNGTSSQGATFVTNGVTGTNSFTITNANGITLTGTMPVNSGATLTINTAAATPISGGTITYAASNSTLAYISSTGSLTASTVEFPASNGPTNLTVNLSAAYPNNKLNMPSSRSLTGTLTMTAGNINMNGGTLMLGASAASPGTLTYTNGYILNGTVSRYLGTAVISSGGVAGRFPLAYESGGVLMDRTLYLDHAAVFTSGGLLAVTYNNASGSTSVTPFVDGTSNIDIRLNSNWVLSQSGLVLGGATNISVMGNGFAVDDYTKLILMQAGSAAGTAGTNTGTTSAPKVVRAFTSASDLTNTFYVGSESTYNSFSPIITAVASGNWGDAATWDAGVPTSINNVVIPTGITVTLNSSSGTAPFSYECSSLTLNGTGTLIGNANILTMGDAGGNNRVLTVNGTLTLAGATLNLNGSVNMNAGATFNMSSGIFNIDGNNGISQASSTASGLALFSITGNITSNVSGGNINFIDPPFAGAGLTLSYSGTNTINWAGNTIAFGDGVSTHTSTATNGFNVNTYVSTGRLVLGNVIVNGGSASRLVTNPAASGDAFNIGGNLTINAGSELRTISTSVLTVGGNIINNGILTNTLAALQLASGASASTVPQTISGTGTFQNAAASSTANLYGLTINNSNATGVTIDFPNFTLSNSLTLTTGILRLGNNNVTLGTAATTSGGSATAMVVQNGTGRLFKTFATGSSSAFKFPLGEETGTVEYSPVSLTFSANTVQRVLSITVTDADHPQLTSNGPQTDYISRYWTITDDQVGNGTYSYIGTFTHTAADLNGTAANIKVNRYDGTRWTQPASSSASNVLTISSAVTETTGKLGGSDFTGRVNPPETYIWNGSVSTDFTVAGNWTPSRDELGANDILQFNNGIANTITSVPTQTIGNLVLNNNTSVNLVPTTTNTLTINGGAGVDLDIASGSSLTLAGTGTNGLTLAFSTGTTGTVAGTLKVNPTTTSTYLNTLNVANTVLTVATNGVLDMGGTLTSASTTTLIVGADGTYKHNRDGGAVPNVTYNVASNLIIAGVVASAPTLSSVVPGNFIWDSPNQTGANLSMSSYITAFPANFKVISTGIGSFALGSGPTVTITGDLEITGGNMVMGLTGSTLTVNGDLIQSGGTLTVTNGTSVNNLRLKGDLIQTGGVITRAGASGSSNINFEGTTNQAVTLLANGVTSTMNYVVTNTTGITLTGTMPVNTGATVTVSVAGTPITGTGSVAYTGTTSLIYNNTTGSLVTGPEFPVTGGPSNITVNITAAAPNNLFTLDNSKTVDGTLTLTSGLLKLGSSNLTFGTTGLVAGGSASSMIIQNGTGRVRKTVPAGASSAFIFPVGEETGTTEYSPASLTFSANSVQRIIGVTVTDADHPQLTSNSAQTDYLSRYWTFTDTEAGNGTYSYTGTFTYLAADINGTEANIRANRYSTNGWTQLPSNAAANILTIASTQNQVSGELADNEFTGRVNPSSDYTWVGSNSADWFDSDNWSPTGIPSGADNVIINDDRAANQPKIPANASVAVKDLTLSLGSISVGADATMSVSGNFTYNSAASTTFDPTSTFVYGNSGAQTIYALTYGNLSSTGTGARTLESGQINIAGTFTTGASTYTPGTSSVNFTGDGAITIPAINYNDLSISGNRTTNNVTLANGTINIAGSFSSTAGFTTGNYVPGTSSVVISNAGTQNIPAINYYNLDATGGDRILVGNIKIAGTFVPGNGTYTSSATTIEYNGTGASLPIPSIRGINYPNLVISGTGSYVLADNLIIDGNYTQNAGTVVIANSAVTRTMNVNGDFNLSGGTLKLIDGSGVLGSTINIGTTLAPKNLNVSGTGTINLESTSSASGASLLKISGNFTSSGTATNVIDFGTGTVTNNEVQIAGNIITSGSAKIYTSATVEPKGIVLNGSNPQTINYASTTNSQCVQVTVNAGSTLVLGTNVTFGSTANPPSRVVVNGILDLADKVLTGATSNHYFTVNAGGVVKTSHASGLSSAVTGYATANRTFSTAADLELYNTGSVTQGTFPTAVRNLIATAPTTLTLGSSLGINGSTTLNNTLVMSTYQFTGTGAVTINGTVKTANVNGLSGTATTALANTLTGITLGSNTTVEYNGTGAQAISPRSDYYNLVISGARSNGAITLGTGSISVANAFTSTATNATWVNTGNTVELTGNGQGVPGIGYNNLTISGGGTRTLAANASVAGTLTLTSGILETGANKVTLTGAGTVSEDNVNYVKGTVESSANMNASGTFTFGNSGLTLMPQAGSTSFPGVTTVRRITGSSVVAPNGNRSITRKFEIVPTVNQNLNVTIVFTYQDHELETLPGTFIDENNLVFFKSADGNAPWAPRSYTSRDVTANTVTLTGQQDFSVWTLGDANSPLPVELVSFTAIKKGYDVEVLWTTAVEKDSRGFEVQVSEDNRTFRTLGFVESQNGNSFQKYNFLDKEDGKSGTRYYRLKQTDLDGTISYFGPKTVRFEDEKLQLTAYPNPFATELNVNLVAAQQEKAVLTITDLTGKTVFVQEIKVLKGLNRVQVGLDNTFAKGVYILNAQVGSENVVIRVLKQ